MPTSKRLSVALSAAALVSATALGTTLPAAQADPAVTTDLASPPAAATASNPSRERAPGTGSDAQPRHSSDGVAGAIAPELKGLARSKVTVANEVTWDLAPGINFRRWDQTDRRGQIRVQLLTVDIANPANEFDYLSNGKVPVRTSVGYLQQQAQAVAAVNGDFFDIHDTGAPLGIGRSATNGLRNAPRTGWNNAFWVDRGNRPHIGPITFSPRLPQFPGINLAGLNLPELKRNEVGVWNRNWGKTAGTSWTAGQKRVRTVMVQRGKVVTNRPKATSGDQIPNNGFVLVGRGMGAAALKPLTVGTRVNLKQNLQYAPKMAITGDRPLLLNGVRMVVDDRQMHPRTAIGIDEDANLVYLVVIDGRQSFSRGYTMVELANFMTSLGVENALNLDGGGSSTMTGYLPTGELAVLNSPSDGTQRLVPNGIGVFSHPVSRVAKP